MERIQFYPSLELKQLLDTEAKTKGISTSTLVIQLLQAYYNVVPKPVMSLADAIPKVLKEVELYVENLSLNEPFDLLNASTTFKQIEMTVEGKPSTNRATLGKIFGSKIGVIPFANIDLAYTSDGKIKKSKNRATMYVKIKLEENKK